MELLCILYFFKSINNYIIFICTKKFLDKSLRKCVSWPINLFVYFWFMVENLSHVTLYLNLNLIDLTIESKKQQNKHIWTSNFYRFICHNIGSWESSLKIENCNKLYSNHKKLIVYLCPQAHEPEQCLTPHWMAHMSNCQCQSTPLCKKFLV